VEQLQIFREEPEEIESCPEEIAGEQSNYEVEVEGSEVSLQDILSDKRELTELEHDDIVEEA